MFSSIKCTKNRRNNVFNVSSVRAALVNRTTVVCFVMSCFVMLFHRVCICHAMQYRGSIFPPHIDGHEMLARARTMFYSNIKSCQDIQMFRFSIFSTVIRHWKYYIETSEHDGIQHLSVPGCQNLEFLSAWAGPRSS